MRYIRLTSNLAQKKIVELANHWPCFIEIGWINYSDRIFNMQHWSWAWWRLATDTLVLGKQAQKKQHLWSTKAWVVQKAYRLVKKVNQIAFFSMKANSRWVRKKFFHTTPRGHEQPNICSWIAGKCGLKSLEFLLISSKYLSQFVSGGE